MIEHETVSINSEIIARIRYNKKQRKLERDRKIERRFETQ
jgi:hypothetical protein